MSVLQKTINICCAALFAVAFFAAPSIAAPSATDSQADQRDSDVYMRQQFVKKSHWMESYYKNQKYKPASWYQGNNGYQPQDGVKDSNHGFPIDLQSEFHRQQVQDGKSPTRAEASGFILPTGYYSWDGRTGYVPNPTLAMPGATSQFAAADSGSVGIMSPMLDMIDPSHSIRTTQITNWEFSALMAGHVQAMNEMRSDPTRWKEAMRAGQEAKQSQTADNQAESSEANADTAFGYTAFIPLINVANENAWQPCAADAASKTYQNVCWMVGQMYKQCYIPMAILFLLPGACATQMKIIIRTGFFWGGQDEDSVSPFSGLMRSMMAVFLIPATQLFVSYTIDVGNALTAEVVKFKPYFDMQRILDWQKKEAFNIKKENKQHHVKAQPDSQQQGKFFGNTEDQTKQEQQSFLSSTGQQWFNTLECLLTQGMVCLNAFQFIMIEYLFLLGPMAAALFAWPGVAQDTFKRIFANWLNGVVTCTLWKFWWTIILLCMSTRLYMMGPDAVKNMDDPYEMFMAAAFGAMLMYIPFAPFDFKPGDLVTSVLEKAQQNVSKGGGGAAAVGSGSPDGGGGGSGGGSNSGGGVNAG